MARNCAVPEGTRVNLPAAPGLTPRATIVSPFGLLHAARAVEAGLVTICPDLNKCQLLWPCQPCIRSPTPMQESWFKKLEAS